MDIIIYAIGILASLLLGTYAGYNVGFQNGKADMIRELNPYVKRVLKYVKVLENQRKPNEIHQEATREVE